MAFPLSKEFKIETSIPQIYLRPFRHQQASGESVAVNSNEIELPASLAPVVSDVGHTTVDDRPDAIINIAASENSDLVAMNIWRSQPEVMEFSIQGRPDKDIEETRTRLEKLVKGYKEGKSWELAIVSKGDPNMRGSQSLLEEVIGTVGVKSFDTSTAELGYEVRKEFWGKGVATAAVKAYMKSWWSLTSNSLKSNNDSKAFIPSFPNSVIGVIVSTNAASRAVLLKSGFSLTREWEEDDLRDPTQKVTLMLFAMSRPQ